MLPFRLFVDTNAPTLLSSQDLERLCGRLCDLAVNPPHFLPTANQQICISLLLCVRWGFNLWIAVIFSFQPLGKTLDSLDIFEGASLIPWAYTFHVFSHRPVRPHHFPSAIDPHRRPAGLLHKAKCSIMSNHIYIHTYIQYITYIYIYTVYHIYILYIYTNYI